MKLFQVISSGQKLEALLDRAIDQYRNYLRLPKKEILELAYVYLREKRIQRFQMIVKKDAVVTFLLPEKCLVKNHFQLGQQQIAYEDDEIIVVDKPSGLPTQSTQIPGEDHLFGAVISYLTEQTPGKLAYVGLHHRLDRDTSGLVLLTKKASMNKAIADQFKDHTIYKKYLAIVKGEKPASNEWKVDAAIRRQYGTKEFRFGIDLKKGDPAQTKFKYVRAIGTDMHMIECQPITGRTHQIRIHLASVKLPIVGDRTYGVRSETRMQLHAHKLVFNHPKTNNKMEVISKRMLELDRS